MYSVGQSIKYRPIWNMFNYKIATIIDVYTGYYGESKYTVRLSDGYTDEIYESQIVGLCYAENSWF